MRYPKFLIVFLLLIAALFIFWYIIVPPRFVHQELKWKTASVRKNLPKCPDGSKCAVFNRANYCRNSKGVPYNVKNVEQNSIRVKITLVRRDYVSVGQSYGSNVSPLVVEITAQTSERVHVKIFDPNKRRWEIPGSLVPIPDDPEEQPPSTMYSFRYSDVGEPFHFSIIRKSDGSVLFDTCGSKGLQFTDQFLSIGTQLPPDYNMYGLGEHVIPSLRLTPRTYTLWNYDTAKKYNNLYGSHPFYLEHRSSGKSHGVFLRNSNGMDIILDQTSLTYNVLGGVLDFYFFIGPKPESVIQQYQEVIGRPKMPPYWGLGFHQCRYGYKNVDELKEVVSRFREEQIPLDTMWTDIDYMDKYKVFTLSPVNFPEQKMREFVDDLHQHEQQYVVIVDPGVKVESGYEPFDVGLKMDIFIKNQQGKVFRGKVWPGITAFPDFLNPRTGQYWETELEKFHKILPVDGIWLDMNEIASFHDGDLSDEKYPSKYNKPPYAINNQGSYKPLMKKTLQPDAVHHGGLLEYDVHNLYGHTETMVTSKALEKIIKKRSFIIARSTFPGTGAYGGHWTGDNHSSWKDLSQSIKDILNFQMYGLPLVGADICGFGGNTSRELCARWIALGAFYPFSRSHNRLRSKPQEPYVWKSVAAVSRKVLGIRYSLLPFYYTLFYKACGMPDITSPAATVLRPLFFEFPHDQTTFSIDEQFMIGSALLISPVLKKGARSVNAYFPKSRWYDFQTFQSISEGNEYLTLSAPLDHIPIHIRGGSIIPIQFPALTTRATRRNMITIIVALDHAGSASGELYWDDGESIKVEQYVWVYFSFSDNSLKSNSYGPKYESDLPVIGGVTILGVQTPPSSVTVNKESATDLFHYSKEAKTIKLTGISLKLTESFVIGWR